MVWNNKIFLVWELTSIRENYVSKVSIVYSTNMTAMQYHYTQRACHSVYVILLLSLFNICERGTITVKGVPCI